MRSRKFGYIGWSRVKPIIIASNSLRDNTVEQDIKLVALDIDGTLLEPGVPAEALPDQRLVETVARLKASGIIVMLATGRMYPGTVRVATHLGIDEPAICQQGASIHEADGSLRHAFSIDQEIALELYEYALGHDYSIAWFDHERYLVTEKTPSAEFFAAVSDVEIEINLRPHETGVLATGIDIISNETDSTGVHRLLEGRYGSKVSLLDFLTVTAIHNPAASKGNALKIISDELGIEQAHVLAIGDGINDVSMLSWAGYSATPSHGDKFAKESAKEVLEGEGVSGVIDRLEAIL